MVWILCSSIFIFSDVDVKVVIKTITKAYLFDKNTRGYSSLLFVFDIPLTELFFFYISHPVSALSKLKIRTGLRVSQVICHFQQEKVTKLIILLIPHTLILSYVISFFITIVLSN